MPRYDDGNQFTKITKGQFVLMGSDTQYGDVLAENFFVESILYVNLKDLADGTNIGGQNPTLNRLVLGKFYLITDATTANIPLMVQATSASTIGTDAKSPQFPQDVIQYNFLTDVILWRWDTINDNSAAQDLRNLVGVTLGSGCTNVHLGKGFTGSIGTNSTNIKSGKNNINVTIENATIGVELKDNVGAFDTTDTPSIPWTSDNTKVVFYSESGDNVAQYYNGSNVLTSTLIVGI